MRSAAMVEGRRADTARRRQRVLAALAAAFGDGDPITVSAIAKRAGVYHTFLYCHRDLLDQLHVLDTQPPTPCSRTLSADSRVGF